jgi:hypothetical protein
VVGAQDAPALLADAALDQVEVDAAGVAIRLDVRFAEESRAADHDGMITPESDRPAGPRQSRNQFGPSPYPISRQHGVNRAGSLTPSSELTVLPVQKQQSGKFSRVSLALTAAELRQHGRLSVGVGGVIGGTMLLAANTMSILVGAATFSAVPFLANAALVFGGVMFLRERRKAAAGDARSVIADIGPAGDPTTRWHERSPAEHR